MSEKRESEQVVNVRPSWGASVGKLRKPPPPPRASGGKTPLAGDTRRVDLQLAGTERALEGARGEIDRLRGALVTSRREAEVLRMTLAQVRALVGFGKP